MSEQWATVYDIIEYGLVGDKDKVRAYTELLVQRLRNDSNEHIAASIERILSGHKGQMIGLAEAESENHHAI